MKLQIFLRPILNTYSLQLLLARRYLWQKVLQCMFCLSHCNFTILYLVFNLFVFPLKCNISKLSPESFWLKRLHITSASNLQHFNYCQVKRTMIFVFKFALVGKESKFRCSSSVNCNGLSFHRRGAPSFMFPSVRIFFIQSCLSFCKRMYCQKFNSCSLISNLNTKYKASLLHLSIWHWIFTMSLSSLFHYPGKISAIYKVTWVLPVVAAKKLLLMTFT